MDTSCRQDGAYTIVTVNGEVDLYSSPQLRTAILSSVSAKTPNVVVDLSGVSYMDSSGIATLVEAHQKTGDASGRLALAGLTDRVREVFELTRLQSIFEICPTVEAALSSGRDAD